MERETKQDIFTWKGISIEVVYIPDYTEATKTYLGYQLGHLGITSKDKVPLPITETGYRSLFVPNSNIKTYKSHIDYVTAWLDEAAKSKKWKDHIKKSSQLTLF